MSPHADNPSETRWSAYRELLTGDFRTASELEPSLGAGDATSRAWKAVFDAARWAAGLPGALPEPEDLLGIGGSTDAEGAGRSAAALAACVAAGTCVAQLDAPGLQRWATVAQRLADEGTAPDARIGAALAGAWCRLAAGDVATLADDVAAIEQEAGRSGHAARVVEAASLGALAALEAGDAERGLAVARRASRMARTESLPQSEYLAHLVLARMRRTAGRVHLAMRILTALGRVAPPSWLGWIAWELLLSGDDSTAATLLERALDGPASRAARAWIIALGVARTGNRGATRAAMLAGERAFADWSAELKVTQELRVVSDPDADPSTISEDAAAWCAGAGELPRRLIGPSTWPRAGEEVGEARILLRVGSPARRILGIGAALADAAHEPVLPKRQLRTETAACVLALAGPEGMSRSGFFRRIYGLELRPATHQSVLDVLLHRVRSFLGESAEMRREDERIALEVRAAMLLPDAPTDRPLDDLLLRALARTDGGASARSVAADLGVALRTVQSTLKKLVDDGECLAERQGRVIQYRVEDTTFSEPTRVVIDS